ncbi:MAG: glycosyltransferase family 2 protein [Defluviitaleaceae bacterium]|nr:glycosyltransferase family 2 protein [Defluviitaleaceae bacterium]
MGVCKEWSKIRFSIIVPAYNISEYIDQCISSILSQKYQNYELILINDGSTDNSGTICDSYDNGEQVRVIHKENGGLSSARNAGLDAALGDYVLFVDGDDFIAEGSLGRIAAALDADGSPDVMFLGVCLYFDNTDDISFVNMFDRCEIFGKSRDAVLAQLCRGGQFHVGAWAKAVRRELAQNTGFWEDIRIGEDVDFSYRLYLAAVDFSLCAAPYYHYRQNRPGSIMAKNPADRCFDLIRITDRLLEINPNCPWMPRFLYHQYFVLLTLYKSADEAARRRLKPDMARLSHLLRHGPKKARALWLFRKIFGTMAASRLLRHFGGDKI